MKRILAEIAIVALILALSVIFYKILFEIIINSLDLPAWIKCELLR